MQIFDMLLQIDTDFESFVTDVAGVLLESLSKCDNRIFMDAFNVMFQTNSRFKSAVTDVARVLHDDLASWIFMDVFDVMLQVNSALESVVTNVAGVLLDLFFTGERDDPDDNGMFLQISLRTLTSRDSHDKIVPISYFG